MKSKILSTKHIVITVCTHLIFLKNPKKKKKKKTPVKNPEKP